MPGAVGPLRARFYAPPSDWSSLLVFFHGGGFVFGDVDSHDGTCRLLCAAGGFAVLSVEYRLAPEYPFPACVDDAWAAWQWVLANAADAARRRRRRADRRRRRLGRWVALDRGLPAGRPGGRCAARATAVDLSGGLARPRQPSMQLFADGFFLTRAEIDFFESCLLRGVEDDPSDFRGHPLAGDLSGLAPAIVVTAGFDPLRDGGEAYAAALQAAGTPATLRRYDSLIHGFINMIGFSPACRAATEEIARETAALFAAQLSTPA